MERIEGITAKELINRYQAAERTTTTTTTTTTQKDESASSILSTKEDVTSSATASLAQSKNGADETRTKENIEKETPPQETLSDNMKSLADRIGKLIGRMHAENIIHGDLTTCNMMIVEPYDTSDVIPIDFGLSSMDERAEDKAVDLYVLERAILSIHPDTDTFVKSMLGTYGSSLGRQSREVIKKLDEVRQRGRKKLYLG